MASLTFNVSGVPITGTARIFAITATNRLISVEPSSPTIVRSGALISGLAINETIEAIDFRPATGELFALGSTDNIYTLNTTTAVATLVSPAALTLVGTGRGFDFNPTVDRIRIVSGGGTNIRVNPTTGVLVATDTALNPGSPHAVGTAYTNSFVGAAVTTLYQIDSTADQLYIQNPPNGGTLVAVGPLGVNASDVTGFDIATGSNAAYAALNVGGTSALFRIDLTTGAATMASTLGVEAVRAIAIQPTILVGLEDGTSLVTFSAANPTVITSTISLFSGTYVGIDYRPFDNMLVGITAASELSTLDLPSGNTYQFFGAFTPVLNGTAFGFDFNPTVDRLRVVSTADQNLRVNPTNGTVVGGVADTPLAYATGDVNVGQNPNVVAAAYSNNIFSATTTTLYGIDSNLDVLVTLASPNNGQLTTVGSLGIDVSDIASLDIGQDGVAYAALQVAAGTHQLYTINLTTGAATLMNAIDSTTIQLRGLTSLAPSNPRMHAVTTTGTLLSFDPATPGTTVAYNTGTIFGLSVGENVLGVDFRPSNGALYAFTDDNNLYTIDHRFGLSTFFAGGAVTPVGNIGFDFNPSVDRIRLTTSTEQNVRLNPSTGALAGTDGALAYATGDVNVGTTPDIVASAYTNNVPGTATTVLYGIDSNLDVLVIQNPPNVGTLTTVGALGVNVDGNTCLDVTQAGTMYMSATVGGVTRLYTINLATGGATLVGSIGNGATPLAGMSFGP
jgi:trimeric autotransporter adhesin